MASSERRKIQNRLAQRKYRAKRSAEKALRAAEDRVYEQPLPRLGNLYSRPDIPLLYVSRPEVVPATYANDPSLQSPLLKPTLRFPPDETCSVAKSQYEITSKILQWLIPVPSRPPVDTGILPDVLQLWHKKDTIFRQELGAQYNTICCVFEAWVQERMRIAELSSNIHSQSGLPLSLTTAMEHIHTLHDLRVQKLTLLNVCADEKLRNELLAKALSLLTETDGVDSVFVHGILRLQQEDMCMLGMVDS